MVSNWFVRVLEMNASEGKNISLCGIALQWKSQIEEQWGQSRKTCRKSLLDICSVWFCNAIQVFVKSSYLSKNIAFYIPEYQNIVSRVCETVQVSFISHIVKCKLYWSKPSFLQNNMANPHFLVLKFSSWGLFFQCSPHFFCVNPRWISETCLATSLVGMATMMCVSLERYTMPSPDHLGETATL